MCLNKCGFPSHSDFRSQNLSEYSRNSINLEHPFHIIERFNLQALSLKRFKDDTVVKQREKNNFKSFKSDQFYLNSHIYFLCRLEATINLTNSIKLNLSIRSLVFSMSNNCFLYQTFHHQYIQMFVKCELIFDI